MCWARCAPVSLEGAVAQRTAAFLIIGDEILSGRTHEKNLPVLAERLGRRGIALCEARTVGDERAAIVGALNALRQAYDYVFTSGGIGSTHDDITSESVAVAFGQACVENAAAVAKLGEFYALHNMPFTPARRRMALMPAEAVVVESDFPGAPAFRVGNVFVCAGVPRIFDLMATAAVAQLPQGEVKRQRVLRIACGESFFSDALREVAGRFSEIDMGSYPRESEDGPYCHVVFSGFGDLQPAVDAFERFLKGDGIEYRVVKPDAAP